MVQLHFTFKGRRLTTKWFKEMTREQQAEVLDMIDKNNVALLNTLVKFRNIHIESDPAIELTPEEFDKAVDLGFDPLFYTPTNLEEAKARNNKMKKLYDGELPPNEIQVIKNFYAVDTAKKWWLYNVNKEIDKLINTP